MMVEYERKILLEKWEYDYLLNCVRECSEAKHQINHYYDTDEFGYNELGITCRIRENGGLFTSAIKEHKGDGKSIEKVHTALDVFDTTLFDGMSVKYQGSLSTERFTISPMKGISVMLDKNSYLGYIDHELEIEYKAEVEAEAMQILECIANILRLKFFDGDYTSLMERVDIKPNKSKRFFKLLTEINRGTV